MKSVNVILLAIVFTAGSLVFAKGAKKKEVVTPEQSLYEELEKIGEIDSNGAKTLFASVLGLSCTWTNETQKTKECTYVNSKGDKKSLKGPKADKLRSLVAQLGKIESDCGAGTCGFREPQEVSCNISKDAMDVVYGCEFRAIKPAKEPWAKPAAAPDKAKSGGSAN
jgi:hypothetical protein